MWENWLEGLFNSHVSIDVFHRGDAVEQIFHFLVADLTAATKLVEIIAICPEPKTAYGIFLVCKFFIGGKICTKAENLKLPKSKGVVQHDHKAVRAKLNAQKFLPGGDTFGGLLLEGDMSVVFR